ncbi:MAG TPA: protein phosphatase CheZ, partial [Gammaproteobacteria bacterium]|nr:protein phosphatase CheZ [Gammaproteobacteria bacterium]
MTSEQNQETLTRAHELITALEKGNNDAVSESLDALTRQHESVLFQELGKMTRELHESINNFKLDARITDLTETDIPDAKERLNYVITMTEDSANKTMDAVDAALPVSESIKNRANELHAEWKRFRERDMSADQFRQLSKDLDNFFPMIGEGSVTVHDNLTKILMAQDFQDLTGQIIRRVITLVQDV